MFSLNEKISSGRAQISHNKQKISRVGGKRQSRIGRATCSLNQAQHFTVCLIYKSIRTESEYNEKIDDIFSILI